MNVHRSLATLIFLLGLSALASSEDVQSCNDCGAKSGYGGGYRKYPQATTECRLSEENNQDSYVACALNNNSNRFRSLYERHLRDSPDDMGAVLVEYYIEHGKVLIATPIKTSIKDSKFLEKLMIVFMGVNFPLINDRSIKGTYLFNFNDSTESNKPSQSAR